MSARARRVSILLPVGLHLQPGVKSTSDTGALRLGLPYSWCFANLCVAALPVGDDIIRALAAARTASIEVVDTNLHILTATIPLEHFGSAQAGAPSQTFEQVIEE